MKKDIFKGYFVRKQLLLPIIFIIMMLMASCSSLFMGFGGTDDPDDEDNNSSTEDTSSWSNNGTGVQFPAALIGTWGQVTINGADTISETIEITSTIFTHTLIMTSGNSTTYNKTVEYYAVTATATEVSLIQKGVSDIPDEATVVFEYTISGSALTLSKLPSSSLSFPFYSYATPYEKK